MSEKEQPEETLPLRQAARLILIDPRDRIFFFQANDTVPVNPERPIYRYWFMPGGGLEPGETFAVAAVRELREETGLEDVEIGPCVWKREQALKLYGGQLALCHERFFVVHAGTSNVDISGLHGYESEAYGNHRWWTLDELGQTTDIVFPEPITDLVEPILAGDYPEEPLWIE